jgi:hypothetical protein
VVGSEDYQAIRNRLIQQLGGIYDTKTGALKNEQARAAEENSRREFVDKNHLDGLVYLALRQTQAEFNGPVALWDGARERSDGLANGPSLFDHLMHSQGYTGHLPAYSALLQIANTEGQIVFGRLGGIQLAHYFDQYHPDAGNKFREVPIENLFRDEKRIARAIHIAAVPLMHSAQEIAAGNKDPSINAELIADLPPQPEGIFPKPESPLKAPRDEVLAKTHRVVITEIAHAGLPLSPEVAARYLQLIRDELKPLGWEIIETDRAFGTLGRDLRLSSGIYDSATGALNVAALTELRKGVFTHLGITPAPDAILWVQVVPNVAQWHALYGSAVVRWDSAEQKAGPIIPCYRPCTFSTDGSIRTTSLDVQLRNPDDVLLYESRGGIEILQQLKGNQLVNLAPTELFQDSSREQPAVHAALRDLTLTPEQLDRELHPPPTPKAH